MGVKPVGTCSHPASQVGKVAVWKHRTICFLCLGIHFRAVMLCHDEQVTIPSILVCFTCAHTTILKDNIQSMCIFI